MIVVPKIREATVRCEDERVSVIVDGRAVLDLPWRAADALARALTAKARQAEEIEKADAVAFDAAVLLRAGVPVGLTNHPKIKAEARKIADGDRRLRRYMPGGIRSRVQFGAPAVRVHPKVQP